jgi:endonuclease/exonuclease/phosphatase family metal-dependent hydrolase
MRNGISIFWFALLPLAAGVHDYAPAIAPELLRFDELVALSNADRPPAPLGDKLERLLKTPFIDNEAAAHNAKPHKPSVEGVGRVVRVVSWNIERGLNFDLIRLAFSDSEGFRQAVLQRGKPWKEQVNRQLEALQGADIILLNEADDGNKRTDYRDVARDLAHALGMNYAFGVEFVEVDRLEDLGLEPPQLEDSELARRMQEDLKPDPGRYRGLHGNAILSRYPIRNAQIVRLPVCHDWYRTEKEEISRLEQGKRFASNKIFLARIEREVRRGGRMALVADLSIPELPGGVATVVSIHLENKCKPECRTKQMDTLLSEIGNRENPIIIGGDLNTTGANGTPTSIRREILNRVKDYEFWIAQALRWGTPASLPLTASTSVNYFRTWRDPTSTHLPVIGANKEATLFRHIERFRFADGTAFDFRGDSERNLHGRERMLANSNQRASKGFEPTFSVKRDFGGLVGSYKLDWLFVKPYIPNSRGQGMSYLFAPHFPLTLRDLNNAVSDGISDHAPIVVDLPLDLPLADALASTLSRRGE